MPSNRHIAARRLAERDAIHASLLARDRRRRKGRRALDLLLDRLPRDHPRDPGLLAAAPALLAAVRRTRLLDPDRGYRPGDRRALNTFPSGLVRLLAAHGSWIRRPESWTARSHNAHRQFASLARHLLCRYDVPSCLDAAWFAAGPDEARLHQAWFIALGGGASIRTVDGLPFALTRRAAHLFATAAPSDLSVIHALRWAQLRALGADERLTSALLGSRMADDIRNDAFWMTVAAFFIRHALLDRRHVGPIVDFIDHRRHRVENEEPPPQPNFSMRGRSPETLFRQVNAWHRGLRRVGIGRSDPSLRWASCGVEGLVRVEGTGDTAVRHRIVELLDAAALRAEGAQMHHCVASYAQSCKKGIMGIFSMTRNDKRHRRTRVTIAVSPHSRTIMQARGPCNDMPKPDQRRILQIWAQEAGLTISPFA